MKITAETLRPIILEWQKKYDVYAPIKYAGKGIYSDTDCVRYGKVKLVDDIVFDKKSEFSFKEVLIKNSERLFYFTENEFKESAPPQKDVLIFLRSCDLHALKRLDNMYYKNGSLDYYYDRVRKGAKFVLIGCENSFENCFCVSMDTNQSSDYDVAINMKKSGFEIDFKDDSLNVLNLEKTDFAADFVTENETQVTIPEKLPENICTHSVWDEYDARCIACGRCNFVCPTCTCYTMQDIYYKENGKVGERRRVHASCMVDGFADMAGGHTFRCKKSERMRYKVLHKISDYAKKFSHQMCVGCGRCDDICPEYISFANSINKLNQI